MPKAKRASSPMTVLVITPPQETPITPIFVASTSGRERRSEFASIVSARA